MEAIRNTLEIMAGYGLSQTETVDLFDVGNEKYRTVQLNSKLMAIM